ncbi:hypothetical protein MASR1M45_31140 [Candidatus Kapaibacterium sp.]
MFEGIDQFLPVDAYISGCPPRPEAVIQALMSIQEKIKKDHKPDLINFGKDVSKTPTQHKYDGSLFFDPLKKKAILNK